VVFGLTFSHPPADFATLLVCWLVWWLHQNLRPLLSASAGRTQQQIPKPRQCSTLAAIGIEILVTFFLLKKTAVKILPFFILLNFNSFGQFKIKDNHRGTPEAQKLIETAKSLYFGRVDTSMAKLLVDMAIKLDSNFHEAFECKYYFEYINGNYDNALQAVIRKTQLNPLRARNYDDIGLIYEIKGDTIMAMHYFKIAQKLHAYLLDTLKPQLPYNGHNDFLFEKGLNLIYVGEHEKGNAIILDVCSSQMSGPLKQKGYVYKNKSRREVINLSISMH
jgi:tetratricopeptide (TPR) repeat protein